MRILGAMLGGTISSYNDKGTVKLGKPNFACGFLSENFPRHEFVFPEFKTYSSEDATPYLYRDALKKITEEARGFEGILITHGTDTCAFFAQLAARVLAPLDIPFVITGAMISPDEDPDEASGNLEYAVKYLKKLHPACYGGLPADIAQRCRRRVIIPMHGNINSLNAAMAAGILMWELSK